MNKYQNAGENCAFFQNGPCRGYLYQGISQYIRSSSSHMYYNIVVLKDLAKFTGVSFQPATLNVIGKETPAYIVFCEFCEIFRDTFIMENLLQTGFERRIL